MLSLISVLDSSSMLASIGDIWGSIWPYLLMFAGFSFIIFIHELGHFLAAKACGIRVEQFAIGFFREIWGFKYGETRYSFNILPLGGYVKMLGQEDFEVDKSGELKVKEDPHSFSNKSIGARMLVVSAGVIANVVLAGVFFAAVYMMGIPGEKATIGYALPDYPADIAGLRTGDTLETIDGKKVHQFSDLKMAVALAEPLEALHIVVNREGKQEAFDIIPLNIDNDNLFQQVGISPAFTNTLSAVGPSFDLEGDNVPKVGDKIISINGEAITDQNANEKMYQLVKSPLSEAVVVVERRVTPKDKNSKTEQHTLRIPSRIYLRPSNPNSNSNETDILGLSPLIKVSSIEPESAAEISKLKKGDVVLKWGNEEYPTKRDIILETRNKCLRPVDAGSNSYDTVEVDIPITVLRKGPDGLEQIELTIRPAIKRTLVQRIKRLFSGNSKGRILLGAEFNIFADELLKIGNIVEEIDEKPTPAKLSNIPAGATIKKVGDEPVTRWPDLAEQLRSHGGETIQLTYEHDGEIHTCDFAVPQSLRTVLGITALGKIISIDGNEKIPVTVKKRDMRGNIRELTRQVSVENWQGTYAKLQDCVGKTVPVLFQRDAFSEPETAEVTVTEDMLDPWVGRIGYQVDLLFNFQTIQIQESNPFAAMMIGAKESWRFIMQVYTTMHRMIFSRSLGVESMSGPVGIVKIGGQAAESGVANLLFFLAVISANLAVINFLPLPIVDGGHMVFLCIEKIKGSPVSIKIQMASQVVGLFLIVIAFLFVTLQDILR